MADLITMLSAAAGAGEDTDPFFKQTTLLLHGDGTNGAQNNTFLDSSTNNFTITRNGNTTQGTFSPFSLPNGEWSNYFDGSGDYLTSADSADWAFGSGNFTLEAWVYRTVGGATQMILIQSDNASAAGSAWSLYITSGNKLQSYVYYGSSFIGLTSSANVPQNEWVHVALVRTSGTVSQYINGSRDGTSGSLSTNSLNDVAQTIGIGGTNAGGDLLTGYLSNVRVIKGSGPYDATSTTLTVPTSYFSAGTSNQKLLTCYSNRFFDSNTATTAKTITVNGNPSVQPFSPFLPSAAYDPSVNGGSGYFDGSGDYLTTPSITVGTSAFCFECWYYPTVTQVDFPGFFSGNDTGSLQLTYRTPTGLGLASKAVGWLVSNTSAPSIVGAWNHVAFVRSSTGTNATSIFLNGARVANGTVTTNFVSSTYNVGFESGDVQYFQGYIGTARFTLGSTPYDATQTTITVPTAPLTNITNTSVLLNFTNAGIFDNTGKNNLETVGNAQIDTSVKKYGTGSMEFDGTTDYVVQPTSYNYGYGTGDFTIEFWLYLNSTSLQTIVSNLTSSSSVNPHIYYNGGVKLYTNNADRISGSPLSTSQWYHIAICRASGSTKLFVNGTQDGSTYSDTNDYGSTAPLAIGTYWASGSPITSDTLNGYIDDLRITKGVARYTAAFTPPSRAFPNL